MVSQRARHLAGAETQHLAQEQDGALVGREVLHRGDERQFQRLVLLVGRLGSRAAGRDSDGLVGVWLEPGRLHGRQAGRGARLGRRPEIVRQDAPAAPLELGQADVRRDPVQPRAGGVVRPQPGQAAPGPHERFLEGIVGVVHRAEHPVAMRVELGPVLLDEIPEGGIR